MKIIIKKLVLASIVFVLVIASFGAMAADPLRIPFPDTPPPPGATWTWVGRQMVVDGFPMSIKNFQFRGSEADMISHFENFWKTLGHGAYRRNKIGPKLLISHETSDYYTTVQYQEVGGVITGSITVSVPLSQKRKSSKPYVRTPPGAKIISQIESNDLGVYSETVTLLSKRTVQFNSSYYANQLQNKGWLIIDNRCNTESCDGHYQSEVGQLQISIKDLPGTNSNNSRILIHLMRQ